MERDTRKIMNESIIEKFELVGRIVEAKPFGNGHINDTFRLINADQSLPDYLLQRVNHEIFKDVDGMMNNIHLVTNHLKEKITGEFGQMTLDLIQTKTGKLYCNDDKGNFWRIFDFKKGTKSYDIVETTDQAYQGARSFGLFFRRLGDFDAAQLIDTIPNFHNIILRLDQLKHAVDNDSAKRVNEVKNELKFIFDLADQMSQIENSKKAKKIPIRVTHNDTKFNNVLLDQNDKGVCVIDLDTVMPGVVHYDFGDGIRTGTNTAAEDEKDLSLVHFDFEKYKAFASGYLENTADVLMPAEIELFGLSGALLAYIMGVRFMTDYIMNDVYYKTKYPNHNLVRSRTQLELTKQILDRLPELNAFTLKEAGYGA